MKPPHPALVGQRFASVAVVDNGQRLPQIVEIGIVLIDDGAASPQTLSWLVRPDGPIARHATRAYHLTDADVRGAPPFAEIRGEVAAALDDRIVVAHRATFTHGLLHAALPGWEPAGLLDTRRLAARVWPSQTSLSLGELARRARLTVRGTQDRAGHSARATAALFLLLVDKLDTTTEWLLEMGRPDPAP